MNWARPTLTRPHDVRNAWLIWLGLVVGLCVMGVMRDFSRSVIPVFSSVADKWIDSRPLYGDGVGIDGFLYLPHAAIMFVPFEWLQDPARSIAWILLGSGLFVWGLSRISRLAGRESGTELFPLATLIAIPVSIAAMRNGQMTTPMVGAMLLATVAMADRKWWWCVFWLCLSIAMKPLAVVLVLLALALNPPLWWRLPIGIVVLLVIPFGLNSFEYVLQCYQQCFSKMLRSSAPAHARDFADIFAVPRLFGLEPPQMFMTLIRVVAAASTLGLCHLANRCFGRLRGAIFTGLLALIYILLFNPRTENNTYIAIAPVLGVLGASLFLVVRWNATGTLVVISALLIGFGFEIIRHLTPGHVSWLSPLLTSWIGLLLVGFIAFRRCPWIPGGRLPTPGVPSPQSQGEPG